MLLNDIQELRPGQVRASTETREGQNLVKHILALPKYLGHLEFPEEEAAVKDQSCMDPIVFCSMEIVPGG